MPEPMEPELPVVTLGSLDSSVAEGQTITATVNVSPAPDSALTVELDIRQITGLEQYGSVIVNAPTTVTVSANLTSASFSITTQDQEGKDDIPSSSAPYDVLVSVSIKSEPGTYNSGTPISGVVGVTEG